jgi:hypothetical protein
MYLSLSDKSEGYMGELYEVAARADTTMAWYVRVDAAVYELHKKVNYLRMYPRTCLKERAYTRYHGRLHINIVKRLSCARGMAAYDVVLQILKVAVVNTPLRHRPETGVYPINHLVPRKPFQKPIAFSDFLTGAGAYLKRGIFNDIGEYRI